MTRAHGPVVAGTFYPARPEALRSDVGRHLAAARFSAPPPKALIAPHAGYVYSGPIAGSAYAPVASARETIRRVVLLGPSHFIPVHGLAVPSFHAWRTPLGDVPIDRAAVGEALTLEGVQVQDEAFAEEHSLEVQLPFLQEVLASFELVPFAVGHAAPADVARVLGWFWGGPETLIVVSSDLSHYLEYDYARERDLATARRIESLAEVGHSDACGSYPVNGLLRSARDRSLLATTADVRSSGDTAGDRRRVVGYGAFLFHPAPGGTPTRNPPHGRGPGS